MKPQMHDGIPVDRPPRRARPPAVRIAAAAIATAALALLAAACSSPAAAGAGSSPNATSSAAATGSTSSASAVAYSQCMRSNGVPEYPDPGSDGSLPKGDAQHFGVSDSQYQAAQHACQHLLPTGGSFEDQARQCIQTGDCPPALVQQMLTADRKFAQCMRAHGVPNWPDPIISSDGAPIFKVSAAGFTHEQTHNPPVSTKIAECSSLDPAPAAMA
jgi:hypothetical protein